MILHEQHSLRQDKQLQVSIVEGDRGIKVQNSYIQFRLTEHQSRKGPQGTQTPRPLCASAGKVQPSEQSD